MGLFDRRRKSKSIVKHSFNVIDTERYGYSHSFTQGTVMSYRPDKNQVRRPSEYSIVSAIYTMIANDVAALSFEHIRVDENGNYSENIDSYLNECLSLSSNRDQNSQQFFIDLVVSLLEEGIIAVVPVETTLNSQTTGAFDVQSMRVAKILQWAPEKVQARVYDERDQQYYDIWVNKNSTAIIENPFYMSMNSPNSTLQRLIRKLALLDDIDEQSGSGKLDLIIQLPYAVKSQSRKALAEERLRSIEEQLEGSKFGVAYIDATEHVTQLNRAVENNLLGQIQYLTGQVYNQLNMTEAVFNGTADQQTMLNYYNRTISPIATSISLEMQRKFLTKTARTRGQAIKYFRDPFKLVPVENLAEIADKMTRNEIMSSNEFRAVIGYKPSDEERADMLLNKNLNHEGEAGTMDGNPDEKRGEKPDGEQV